MAKEKNCKWYFADQPAAAQDIGPNNAMEQSFRQNPYESLVRESIQNSLDAVLDKSQPVRVRYEYKNLEGYEFPEFFKLAEHIQGCLDYYPNNPNAKAIYTPMLGFFEAVNKYHQNIGFLRVSDYNTTGMDYNIENHDSPFYAFVRSAGVSSKSNDTAAGSYGFGKAAYYQLSPISTILVCTYTPEDKCFFEGISSLCTHSHNGVTKMAIGYYDDQNNGTPTSNIEDIPVRFRRTEPGTNFDIMGFHVEDKDEALEEMTLAVLRNFWLAVYEGRLVVEIGNDYVINQENLVELMEKFFPDSLDNTKRFSNYNPRPYLDAVRFADSTPQYTKYEANLPLLGHVDLYTNRCKNSLDKIILMREQRMRIDGKKPQTGLGLCGVFVCTGKKGNDALRHMEPTAHDSWKAALWKVNGKVCTEGKAVLNELDNFIQECLSNLSSSKKRNVINIKGLDEFLYIPTDWDEDEELQQETFVGNPSGELKEDGSYHTTELPNEDNPQLDHPSTSSSTGQVLINRTTRANNTPGGNLFSGHGEATRKPNTPGIPKPGDVKTSHTKDDDGKHGIYATPIVVPYRSFSQIEDGAAVHYIVLHSDEEVGNVRLRFYAVGEESDELLYVTETNVGNVDGERVRDIHLNIGTTRIRVKFADNMKHSVKLLAEEVYEL